MAYTDTKLNNLIINVMTEEQFSEINPDENQIYLTPVQNNANARNIGDIFYTTRTDTELNGAVECNGATFSTADFTGSESIGTLLNEGKVPYVSLTEYANIVSENGSCRAFGWDGGTNFRVPTIPALLLTKEQASVVGNGLTLGLTNSVENFGLTTSSSLQYNPQCSYGAFSTAVGTVAGANTMNDMRTVGVTTDASKSGIVSNLSTVQYRAMVQLANGANDEALIIATSALQQIANKVDKTSATDIQTVMGWGMPDYSKGISVSSPYTTTFPCYVTAETHVDNWESLILYADDVLVSKGVNHDSGSRPEFISGFVDAGVVIRNNKNKNMIIYPLKGV